MSGILCISKGCKMRSKFGKRFSNVREYCITHTIDGYVDLTVPMCKYDGCFNPATHTLDKILEYCALHKPDNYKLGHMLCIKENCYYRATFGFSTTNIKEYCGKHCELDKHVSLSGRICMYDQCFDIATGPHTPYTREFYCKKHFVPKDSVNAKRCIFKGCKCLAYYGLQNGPILYCVKHYDKRQHVSLRGRLCPYKGCKELMVGKEKKCKFDHRVKKGKVICGKPSNNFNNTIIDISISTIGASIGPNIIADMGITFDTDDTIIDPCADLDKYAQLDPIGMSEYLRLESYIIDTQLNTQVDKPVDDISVYFN